MLNHKQQTIQKAVTISGSIALLRRPPTEDEPPEDPQDTTPETAPEAPSGTATGTTTDAPTSKKVL